MKYINTFKTHASYEEKINGGGVDISLPNVSYCEDVKDVHYNPYNTVEFYVCEITPPQTVKIYTDLNTSVDIEVSEGNKWYSYVLPKDDKGLCKIESGLYDEYNEEWSNGIVKKAIIKANINYNYNDTYNGIVPWEMTDVSFKGSNTSNVTDMNSMFYGCSGLTSLDLRNFNTSNVTDMSYMFGGCMGLTSLDVSNFNTSNVTYIYGMFRNCSSLTSLYLSNFNTSNVTDMMQMFDSCNGLTSLDLRSFDTSNVDNMTYMFNGCRSLTSLDLSNFNTSNVIYMSNMFDGCSGLTSLDLSRFDTSNVIDMVDMFSGCSKLKTIRMVGCSQTTIDKIKAQLTKDNITGVTIVTE